MTDNNISHTFPKDFPAGLPDDQGVTPAEGQVYRLVRDIPPNEIDFQRHRDEKPDYPYTREQLPLSYGMSFWTKLDKLKRKKKNFPAPEQYSEWKIAYGTLVAELGVIPKEIFSNGHVTLWAAIDAEPHLHIKHEVEE